MNKKSNQSFNEDDEDNSCQPFYVSYTPKKTGTFQINIGGPIHTADQFLFAIQALEAADEDNDVKITLQSPGGSLGASDALIHAMRKCDGHIHIVATGNVSSAGTFILLEADSFELSENFNATLHCGSVGSGGNYNEFKASSEFYNRFMPKALRSAYQGFLSEDELTSMLDGKDIILDADEWCIRHQARNEYFKAKLEAAEHELAESSKFKPLAKKEATLTVIPQPEERKKPRKTKVAA